MKKTIALLISLCMLLGLAACGDESQPVAPVDTRQGFENLQLKLGDGLPGITMWGTYYLRDIKDEYAADGMVASYYTDIDSEPDYDFYQWEKGDMTLEQVALKSLSKRSVIDEFKDYNRFDTWEEYDGYDYAHYVTMNEYEGKPYIVQSYYFATDEYYIAMDRWNKLESIDTGADGVSILLPVGAVEADYTTDSPKTLKSVYYDPEQRFPIVYTYQWDEEMSYNDVIARLSESYKLTSKSPVKYNEEISGGFVQYNEQDGDQLYAEREFFFLLEDRVVLIDFLSMGGNMAAEISVPALYQGIEIK